MDVFALRDSIIGEYERFATSFTTIRAADLRTKLKAFYEAGTYWPEPLIQLNPHYERGRSQAELVEGGVIHPKCPQLFRLAPGVPLPLHKHQELAAILATTGASYVVTTGTGSGKSLCFFVPIVSAVLKEREAGGPKKTRAIVIYPMNALANSQLEELEKYLGKPGEAPVTYARYTGTEKQEEREAIAANPPDIILTNFMMLELLMTRQDPVDRQVMANCEGLRFLVLDELHTYRGRQGADVALLVRRVRERLSPDKLQCIGTSATMASGDVSQQGKSTSSVVSRVASQLFGAPVPETNVITEWLRRQTTGPHLTAVLKAPLAKALKQPLPKGVKDAELTAHPLSIWVETRLGITVNPDDQTWRRARPLSVSAAVKLLSEESGAAEDLCRDRLREFLLLSSQAEKDRTGDEMAASNAFFAFKLHQFISGASNAYATLEPAGARTVTVDAQKFLPGAEEKRLYPVHFCRTCGHEYHPVKMQTGGVVPEFLDRSIDDAPVGRDDDEDTEDDGATTTDEGEKFGFLTRHAPEDSEWDFDGTELTYPESWLDERNNLKPSRRHRKLVQFNVLSNGKAGAAGQPMWFLPGRFGFCVVCKEVHGGTSRDRTRLASLTAEGRSSATTVLTLSALRWMHGSASDLKEFTRKLLGFSDNRQDAALQAGHFNDFLFVCLLRAGFLGALEAAGAKGISSAELGEAQQKALGFHRTDDRVRRGEWMKDPDAKPFARVAAEKTLRELLAYRTWFDQRRGWRYTNPNLEQLRLVEVEYEHLGVIVNDQASFADAPPVLHDATPDVRRKVYRVLFDHMRKWMAVDSSILNATAVEQLRSNAYTQLRSPWSFSSDEKTRPSRWLMVSAPTRRGLSMGDEDLLVRGGSRSALGKALRSKELWDDDRARTMSAAELEQTIKTLLEAARGLVSEDPTPFEGHMGWRLKDAHVRFRLGSGEDPERPDRINRFFRDLYRSLSKLLAAQTHPLFGFEAREHTAQVDDARRIIREKRFRYGEKEQQELTADAATLAQLGEPREFLPVLFCSPTMELGVDIAQLNTVYLRNMPPTPANYAQRSGRAGRSGQAALVLTYCSAQSPHDQYFFRDPPGMVHGVVRPPMLELANQDLVESHLHAIWLANSGRPLDASIAKLVKLDLRPTWPLQPDLEAALSSPEVTSRSAKAMERFLAMLKDELTPTAAPWFDGVAPMAQRAAKSAFKRFAGAFQRWRDLYEAAHLQMEESRRIIDAHTSNGMQRKAAERRHSEAVNQISLLDQGTESARSDFYTYRYLATEGFLPGYNFPRLPLMAYVPATDDGRGKQTYLQRPRFLALSEFGPRSLIYHEGRAYRVTRAMLSLANPSGGVDVRLPTQSARLCRSCGAGHFTVDPSVCHACRQPLGDSLHVREVFRIENVGTRRAERITANDEERQRQGFELQTTFEWAEREGKPDIRPGAAKDDSGDVLQLTYGPSATITRLNLGLRRRARRNEHGFMIDPVSGDWAKGLDEDQTDGNDAGNPRQRIVPMVRDRKNALLVRPSGALEERSMTTLQYALLRGLQAHFQLEEAEVLGEPMPTRDDRKAIFFYEATEGGAGVLTQVLAQPEAMSHVARRALEVMHFDMEKGLPTSADQLKDKEGTRCVAACYRCLMSYYNQPDHENIDRRDGPTRELLLRLARGVTERREEAVITPADLEGGGARARFMHQLTKKTLPPPEATGWEGADFVWRQDRVVVCLGVLSDESKARFDALSMTAIVFEEDERKWKASFAELARALGKG